MSFIKKAILVGHVINQGRNIYNGVYLQRSLAKLPKQHKPARALTATCHTKGLDGE